MSPGPGDVYRREALYGDGATPRSNYLVVLCDGPSGMDSVYTALTILPFRSEAFGGCHSGHPARFTVGGRRTVLGGETDVMIDRLHLVSNGSLDTSCEYVGRLAPPVIRGILECAAECVTLSGDERDRLQAAARNVPLPDETSLDERAGRTVDQL